MDKVCYLCGGPAERWTSSCGLIPVCVWCCQVPFDLDQSERFEQVLDEVFGDSHLQALESRFTDQARSIYCGLQDSPPHLVSETVIPGPEMSPEHQDQYCGFSTTLIGNQNQLVCYLCACQRTTRAFKTRCGIPVHVACLIRVKHYRTIYYVDSLYQDDSVLAGTPLEEQIECYCCGSPDGGRVGNCISARVCIQCWCDHINPLGPIMDQYAPNPPPRGQEYYYAEQAWGDSEFLEKYFGLPIGALRPSKETIKIDGQVVENIKDNWNLQAYPNLKIDPSRYLGDLSV